jgi:hypothetical protein
MADERDDRYDERDEAILAEVLPIRFSVFQSTIGEMVARAYRVDPLDHSRDEMVRVMDGVRGALDARERMVRLGWYGTGEDSYARRKGRLVEYLRDGHFMSDLYEDDDLCRLSVQMTWDQVLTTMIKKSNHTKPSRVWMMDQLAWFRLESAVDAGEHCGRSLARELDISPTSLGTLCHMYEAAGRVHAGA